MAGRLRIAMFGSVGLTVVLASTVLVPSASAQDDSTFIDFEDYRAGRTGSPAAPPVDDFYFDSGIVLVGATALIYDDLSIPADPDFARSGSVILTSCYSTEFCSNHIEMEFIDPQERVQLWVGYQFPLEEPAELILEGLGETGAVVAQSVVAIEASDSRAPVRVPIEISSPDGAILAATIRWGDTTRFLSGLAIDDINFTPFVAVREVALSPDPAEFTGESGSATQVITVTNIGTVDVLIGSATLEAPGSSATDLGVFTVDDSACRIELSPGNSCSVSVVFDATDSGVIEADLIVRAVDGGPLGAGQIIGSVQIPPQPPPVAPTSTPTPDAPTPPDPPTTSAAEWIILIVILILAVLGLVAVVRRLRHRPSLPEPEVTVRADPWEPEPTGLDQPAMTLRAALHPSTDHISITEEPR